MIAQFPLCPKYGSSLVQVYRDNAFELLAGLHLACANGHMKMVELLLGSRASVSVADRWGGTPLEDAVTAGHVPVANLLRSKGATMRPGSGASKFCDAAARGNVVALRMLHGCRVAELDGTDYDGRTALMVAAAEGRLLAVSFLLSSSCAPNLVDRWGSTALDDALRGGTLYHFYCARLIQSWGGRSATFVPGDEALRKVDGVDIDEVRRTLRRLIDQGYDQRVPLSPTDHELHLAFETCVAHVPLIARIRDRVQATCALSAATASGLDSAAERLTCAARPLCVLLDKYPFLLRRRHVGTARQCLLIDQLESISLRRQAETTGAAGAAAAAAMAAGRAQTLKRMLSRLMKDASADGVVDEEEQAQITGAWGNLEAAERETRLYSAGAPDSDEEAELWAETDRLMYEREYCEEQGLDRVLYRAARFRSAAARLGEIEDMFTTLCYLFRVAAGRNSEKGLAEGELRVSLTVLISFLTLLDQLRAAQPSSLYEAEEIFAEASVGKDSSGTIPIRRLLAQSVGFRESLLDLDVDEVWFLLNKKTRLGHMIPEILLRELADGGCVEEVHRGEVMFCMRSGNWTGGQPEDLPAITESAWFVVVSGSFSVESMEGSSDSNGDKTLRILGPGSCFGGAASLTTDACKNRVAISCSIKARTGGRILRFLTQHLNHLRENHPAIASWLAIEMAESVGELSRGGDSRTDMDASLHSSLSNSIHCAQNNLRPIKASPLGDKELAGPPSLGRTILRPNYFSSSPIGIKTQSADQGEDTVCNGYRRAELAVGSTCSFAQPLSRSFDTTASQGPSLILEERSKNPNFAGVQEATSPLVSTSSDSMELGGDIAYSGWASDTGNQPNSSAALLHHLYVVKTGLICITETWQALSSGDGFISKQALLSLRGEVGEIGSGIFARLFLAGKESDLHINETLKDIQESEYWELWMQLLADKSLEAKRASDCVSVDVDREEDWYARHNMDMQMARMQNDVCDVATSESDEIIGLSPQHQLHHIEGVDLGLTEWLKTALYASRKLNFLDEGLIVSGRYEQAWLQVVGDLNSPLQTKDLALFIRFVFLDFKHKISSYHCNEFLHIFWKRGKHCEGISWADMKKVIRSKNSRIPQNLFVDTVLHPESKYMLFVSRTRQFLAVFHFVTFPLRLCFVRSSEGMLGTVSFCIYLVADMYTFLYVIIRCNTAYKSTNRNQWVTERWKIAKKVSNMYFISAMPLDWVAYGIGASFEICLWFRITKLLFSYQAHKEGAFRCQSRPLTLILWSVAAMHMFSCFWFYIGQIYQFLNPAKPFSWFKVGYPLDDPRYRADSPQDGNGYEYHGLSCNETQTATCFPEETWYYYGMGYEDPWTASYILSFYFSCTRVADQSLTGNIVPQNFLEVCYCIGFILLNLTAYRYVIGELSAWVIGSDEDMVSVQSRAMKVLDFISGNKLSKTVENEIKEYVVNSGISSTSVARCTKVLRLLPHSLQVEISRHVCGDVFDSIALFKDCNDRFKDYLSISMTTVAFSPGEYIYRLGEVATDMYIMYSGSADELVEDQNTLSGLKLGSIVRPGQAFGELAFFFELQCVMAARASRIGGSICLKLGRERFLQILKYCPEEEERITENAMRCFEVLKKSGQSVMSFGASSVLKTVTSDGKNGSTNSFAKHETSAASHSSDEEDSQDGLGLSKGVRQTILQLKCKRKLFRVHMLLSSAKSNDLPGVLWALKGEHIDVNCSDDLGRTALHVAASEGHSNMVQALLQTNIDINVKDHKGNTALNDAVRHHHDAVAALIRTHAPDQSISLPGFKAGIQMCEAAASGNLNEIMLLVTNKVPVQACDYDCRYHYIIFCIFSCNKHQMVEVVAGLHCI